MSPAAAKPPRRLPKLSPIITEDAAPAAPPSPPERAGRASPVAAYFMSFVSELAPVPESAFPCPPLRRRIRAGEGVRGTWRGGDGRGERGAYGPAAWGRPPRGGGRAALPGAPVPRGDQGFGCARNTNKASRGPRPCPLRARTRRGPSPTPPPPRTLLPGPARAGGAGGASRGFAARAPRLAPQPRVRAPAGTPPRGLPARAVPRGWGHRFAGTHQPSASRPAARKPGPRPAPAALAPKQRPERARRLRSEAPAAMIAGSGARARTLGPGLGTRGGPTVSSPTAAQPGGGVAARPPASSLRG